MPKEARRSRALTGALRFWAPHEEQAWVPCSLKGEAGDDVTLAVEGGLEQEDLHFDKARLQDFQTVLAEHEKGVDDVCSLPSVPEGALLHTVRVRYRRHEIYTRVARTVIAVNPFCALPIYSSQCVDQYMSAVDSVDLPPHIFGLSKDALQGIRSNSCNQAVLISGESGAGKTESAKLILSFVADAVRSSTEGEGITEKVLQTNPVMEAFGNAMTVRNNNSSRFGKWLDLGFSGVGASVITGCRLTSYLLETTRVCGQASDERGFHVFFQLTTARNSPHCAGLSLKESSHYRYINRGQRVAPGIDDARCFEELCDALKTLGFTQEARTEIFRAVAGVLLLGNCEFDKDSPDQAKLADPEPAKGVARHFGVEDKQLQDCFLVRKLQVGKDVTKAPLRLEQAQAARDALARLLYGRIFLHLIEHMNAKLTVPGAAGGGVERLLGVLDIAGFESFETNSLEQLTINLSNEQLQQHFNNVVIKDELKECELEGVAAPDGLNFTDNVESVALIDGKGGILDLLDETMGMPKASNQSFVTYVLKQHKDHGRLITSKIARLGFGIAHYAGDVIYSCEGWLEKNANNPPNAAMEMLAASQLACFQDIHKALKAEMEEGSAHNAPGRAKVKTKSATMLFRVSLRSLAAKINEAQSHFMRCVKPNKEKVPGKFVGKMVMEQLVLSGVLATVHIRQRGFAHRIAMRTFYSDYRCVSSRPIRNFKADAPAEDVRTEVHALLTEFGAGKFPEGSFAMGKTKVFGKSAAMRALDTSRRQEEGRRAVVLQRHVRGRAARRRASKLSEACTAIRKFLEEKRLDFDGSIGRMGGHSDSGGSAAPRKSRARRLSLWLGGSTLAQLGSQQSLREAIATVDQLINNAAAVGLDNFDVLRAERARLRMQRELEVSVATQDPELKKCVDPVTLDKVLARARGLALPRDDTIEELEDRIEKLHVQLPLVVALKVALNQDGKGKKAVAFAQNGDHLGDGQNGDHLSHLYEVTQAVEEADLAGEGKWLPELEGAELFAEAARQIAAAEAAAAKAAAEAAAAKAAAEAAAAEAAAREVAAAEAAAAEAAAKAAAEVAAAEVAAEAAAAKERAAAAKEKAEAAAAKEKAEAEEAAKAAKAAEAVAAAAPAKEPAKATAAAAGGPAEAAREAPKSTSPVGAGAPTPVVELSAFLAEEGGAQAAHGRAHEVAAESAAESASEMSDAQLSRRSRFPSMKGSQGRLAFAQVDARESARLMLSLQKANDEYDAEALETLLRQSEKAGLNAEELAAARQTFENLQVVEFVVTAMEKVEKEASQPSASLSTLQRLENLSRQLRSMSGYEAEVTEAGEVLQAALVQRFKRSDTTSVFLSQDPEEVKLGNRAFSSLAQYSGLKSARSWTGQRRSRTSSRAPMVNTEMLLFSKTCIASALTRAPRGMDEEEYEAGAIQNFRNILVCMGDRSAQACQRQASRDAVLAVARLEPSMRSEVYLQVLKQVTGNPNPRSARLGWELMHSLCLDAPPPPEIAEFVRAAFRDAAADTESDAAGMASACRALLDRPEAKMKLLGASAADVLSFESAQRLSAVDMERLRQAAEIRQLKEEMARLRSTGSGRKGQGFWSQWCVRCGDR